MSVVGTLVTICYSGNRKLLQWLIQTLLSSAGACGTLIFDASGYFHHYCSLRLDWCLFRFALLCLFSLGKKETEKQSVRVECKTGVTRSDSRPVSALLLVINSLDSGSLSGPLFGHQHTIKGNPNFHVGVNVLQFYEIFIELLVFTIFF